MEVIGIVGILIFVLIYLGVIALMIVSWWKVLEKAEQPGWAILIPVYNFIVILNVVKKPMWWIALLFIPIANIVMMILIMVELAKVFGKDTGFVLGLIFLGFVFIPILAFGDAVYEGTRSPSNVDVLDL